MPTPVIATHLSPDTIQQKRDKQCIQDLANNNGESWFLEHTFFVNDNFEYILNTERTSFILYSKSTTHIPIQHFGNERSQWLRTNTGFKPIDQLYCYAHQFESLQLPCYHILFCLTDKSCRGQGHFGNCLQELKCKANADNLYILADTRECHLAQWGERHFVVSNDESSAGKDLWEILWGVYTRDIDDRTMKRKRTLLAKTNTKTIPNA